MQRFSETPAITVEIIADPGDAAPGAGEEAAGPTAAALGNAGVGCRHCKGALTSDVVAKLGLDAAIF